MKRCPTAIVGAAGEDGAEPLSCLYSNGRARLLLLVVGLRRSIGNGLSLCPYCGWSGGRTAGKVVGMVQAFSLPAAFRIAVRIPSVS